MGPNDRQTDRVAVVVPMHHGELSADGRISLAHLERHLSGYPRFLLQPRSLGLTRPDFETVAFDDRWFASQRDFSALLLREAFYRAFEHFEFVLIYQLDCLVFSDELLAWCDAGYDYVGAPWLHTPGQVFVYDGPERCGNGGFSLRRVEPAIRALEKARTSLGRRASDASAAPAPLYHAEDALAHPVDRYPWNEDVFWSFAARAWLPEFAIAPVDAALAFAFECDPRLCFERNGRKLPFGCHGWARHDRAFWEPYLLSDVG